MVGGQGLRTGADGGYPTAATTVRQDSRLLAKLQKPLQGRDQLITDDPCSRSWRTRRSPPKDGHRQRDKPADTSRPAFDIPIAGLLLSSDHECHRTGRLPTVKAQSTASRLRSKALTDVKQILETSAPAARSTSRRSSSPRKAAAVAESKSEVKPERKRLNAGPDRRPLEAPSPRERL